LREDFVIFDLRFPIAKWFIGIRQSQIRNLQSAIKRPTRYRVVVLTSFLQCTYQ
jgi:hypothetical protein